MILICGDPHGEFRHIVRAALELKPAAVILLGDLQPKRPLHEELGPILGVTWFIHGNHDTDSEADFANVFDSTLASRNLHGRVVTLPDGTRVAGLGGVFRESVWYPPASPNFESTQEHAKATPRQDRWREGPHRRHWSSIYPDVVYRLVAERADILVTHEAPRCHPNGFPLIDDLARAMGASAAFHGHHHDALDYSASWGSLGFRAYGVGLRGITDETGRVIERGQVDDVKAFRQQYLPASGG